MNIHLDVNEITWSREEGPEGPYSLGELSVAIHPKFQKTWTPEDVTLVVENKATGKFALFTWHQAFLYEEYGCSRHTYKIKLLKRYGVDEDGTPPSLIYINLVR